MKIEYILYLIVIPVAIYFGAGGSYTTESVEKFMTEKHDCEEVVDLGYTFWGCGKSDFYRNDFICYKHNRKLEGILCGGYFVKGITVRWK